MMEDQTLDLLPLLGSDPLASFGGEALADRHALLNQPGLLDRLLPSGALDQTTMQWMSDAIGFSNMACFHTPGSRSMG